MRPGIRGMGPQGWEIAILAGFLAVGVARPAAADPAAFVPTEVSPDAPARTRPPALPVSRAAPSWDLDGLYLWLGPTGAASHLDDHWDSTVGFDATVVRVREAEPLGAIGATLGASRWTRRGGGRLWLDAVVGTTLGGRMYGVSAGPVVELADLSHPHHGGSVGIWGFFGVTPYARIGEVAGLGMFAEVGVHLALPVLRRRH
jgi:hypothetical protein